MDFIATARKMAAGNNDVPGNLLITLESYTHLTVSTEGWKEILAALWARIKEIIEGLGKLFKAFWNEIMEDVPRMRRNVTIIKARSRGAYGRPLDHKPIQIGRELLKLQVRGTDPAMSGDVLRGMADCRGQLGIIYGDYVARVIKTGDRLKAAYALPSEDPMKYFENVTDAARNLGIRYVESALHTRAYRDQRFGAGEVTAASHMLGNKTLFVTSDDRPRNDSTTPAAISEAIRSCRITLSASEPRPYEYHETSTMMPWSAKEVDQLCEEIERTLDMVDKFSKGGDRRKLESLYADVQKAADAAKDKFDIDSGDEGSSYYQASLRYVQAYGTWASNPHDSLTTHVMSVMRAVLVFSNKSIQAHK
jgi:hypothetical protein